MSLSDAPRRTPLQWLALALAPALLVCAAIIGGALAIALQWITAERLPRKAVFDPLVIFLQLGAPLLFAAALGYVVGRRLYAGDLTGPVRASLDRPERRTGPGIGAHLWHCAILYAIVILVGGALVACAQPGGQPCHPDAVLLELALALGALGVAAADARAWRKTRSVLPPGATPSTTPPEPAV